MKALKVALIYNAAAATTTESPEDRGSVNDLRKMIRRMARALRSLGHQVEILPLSNDLMALQWRMHRLQPDAVFNQYDDVVHGALYEMRVAALVRMMGYPMTGSTGAGAGTFALQVHGLHLAAGRGDSILSDTHLLERVGDVNQVRWQFPVIVQPSQEHAGIGVERDSVVHSRAALKDRVRRIRATYGGPGATLSDRARVQCGRGGRPAAARHAAGGGGLQSVAGRNPADHVVCGQMAGRFRRIQENLGDLSGDRRTGIGAQNQHGLAARLPRCQRLGLWARGYPARRGGRAVRAGGELYPRRSSVAGALGPARRHQLPAPAANDSQCGARRHAIRCGHAHARRRGGGGGSGRRYTVKRPV